MTPPPQQTFPPISRRPCYCCYGLPFIVGTEHFKEGVYYHCLNEEKDASGNVVTIAVDLWICSILRVLCIVRTDSGNEHAYLLEYVPHGETQSRRAVLSQALLLGRGEEAMKELRDLGISVLGNNAKYVREYLDGQHLKFSSQKTPDDFWTSVKVIGWAPVGERFVLPNEIIGRQTGVWFSGRINIAHYRKSGDFNVWKSRVAAPCEGNSYLILALSCAFAGPLLEPLNIPGLGFHYFGDSTTGKSTSLAVSASAWGPEKFMISWRTTINGLEIQAASRSSTLIPVDESHQVDPKVLDASVYMLLNGTAKARMNKDISPREIEHWRACVLSSGERSIETHQATAKIEHKVGQTVRIIDVPVVTGPYGLFEDIHEAKNGAEFSDALRDAATRHYGHAGPSFVEKFIANFAGLQLSARLADILEEFGIGLSAQDTRVARSFALIALAGELAIEWRILPWPSRSALSAAINIFNLWSKSQPRSTRSKENAQILRNISDFLGAYGDTRCTDVKPKMYTDVTDPKNPVLRKCEEQPLPKGINRAGYWDDTSGHRIYLLSSAALVEAGKFDLDRILVALQDANALAATGTGNEKAKRRRTPDGRNPKLYWIDPEKLDLNL
jgi:putative DNA primase/helicase